MKLVVGAALLRDGCVLLGLRAPHRSFPNCWDLLGGHVEDGETEERALVRELREEAGIEARAYHFVRSVSAEDVALHIYAVTAWSGEPTMCGDEHVELRWFPFAEATTLSPLATEEYRSLFQRFAAA